jgi:hypothetical protein
VISSDIAATHRYLPVLDWVHGHKRDWRLPDVLAGFTPWAVMVPEADQNDRFAPVSIRSFGRKSPAAASKPLIHVNRAAASTREFTGVATNLGAANDRGRAWKTRF